MCLSCKEKQLFIHELFPKQFKPYYKIETHYVAKGCESCFYTGYKGRKAVYEVIPIDQELSIEIKKENMYVQGLLEEREIKTLARNAFDLFASGDTSIDEIYPLLFNY